MSIKEMNRVWDKSSAGKTSLLAMLALADMANDSGICWPGQDTLAQKARTTRRTVINIVQELVGADELAYISRPGKQHVYCVLVGLSAEEKKMRIELFRAEYTGELHTRENSAHVLKTSHLPVEKTSHLPVQEQAQNCTRSIIDPPIDPSICKRKRAPDPIFDTIASRLFGITDGSAVNGSGGRIAKAKKAIREVDPGVTVQKIIDFCQWYHDKYPKADLPRDPEKIKTHWLAWQQKAKKEDVMPDYSRGRKGYEHVGDAPTP